MGRPLTDITIYTESSLSFLTLGTFRSTANYICDFYHQLLNGYKPHKTSRICIHLTSDLSLNVPTYSGSLCTAYQNFDSNHYSSICHTEKRMYILDALHESLIRLADIYSWDKAVFISAYQTIAARDFIFELYYPPKRSKDGKYTGQVIIEKSEDLTKLYFLITGEGGTKKVMAIESHNRYWFDNSYNLAKQSRWFSNTAFGVQDKTNYHNQSKYSLESQSLFCSFE